MSMETQIIKNKMIRKIDKQYRSPETLEKTDEYFNELKSIEKVENELEMARTYGKEV